MLQAHAFTAPQIKAQDLHGLSPEALAEVAAQMLEHIGRQNQQIAERDRTIKFKDAKLERITFELARLKAWKFAARTEAMNVEQRQLFEETLAADKASLQAQLEALQAQADSSTTASTPAPVQARRQPKRQALQSGRQSTRCRRSGERVWSISCGLQFSFIHGALSPVGRS